MSRRQKPISFLYQFLDNFELCLFSPRNILVYIFFRSWDNSILERGIGSITEEVSDVYSDAKPDEYKISVACAHFLKFFNLVTLETSQFMVGHTKAMSVLGGFRQD